MRPFIAVFSARARLLLQYRAAAFAGFVTQLFWGGIRMMIFTAFYASAGGAGGAGGAGDLPMDLAQTVGYIWLGQAFLALIPFRLDGEIAALVRSGQVACELLRPVGLYNFWMARSLANRLTPTLLRCLPMLMIAGLMGWIPVASPMAMVAFALAMTMALVLAASLAMLMNISLFWTVDGRGVAALAGGLLFLLSGMIVPLPLMPPWMQPLIALLPFRGMIDLPFRLLLGDLPISALPSVLTQQAAWSAALILLGHSLLTRATRRLVVQGG